MDRRRFVFCSGLFVTPLGGCLNRSSDDTPDATPNRTDQDTDQAQNETTQQIDHNETAQRTDQNDTIQQGNQTLVLVNMGDTRHRVRVTVSGANDEVLNRTAEVAADERRRFALDIDEPGTYEISASVDGNTTEMLSITRERFDIRSGSDVFLEFNNSRPRVYWEE